MSTWDEDRWRMDIVGFGMRAGGDGHRGLRDLRHVRYLLTRYDSSTVDKTPDTQCNANKSSPPSIVTVQSEGLSRPRPSSPPRSSPFSITTSDRNHRIFAKQLQPPQPSSQLLDSSHMARFLSFVPRSRGRSRTDDFVV